MGIESIVGGLAGPLIGGLLGGASGGGGEQQTVDKRPWEEMIPYLTGQNGIFPQAQQQFTDSKNNWATQYQPAVDAYTKQLQERGNNSIFGGANQLAQNMMGGQFDYRANPVQSIGTSTIGGGVGQAGNVDTLRHTPWAENSAGPMAIMSQNIRAPAIGAISASDPATMRAQQVDISSARAGQGAVDPTQALSSLLSGKVNNPYLQQQANAITGDITRNLQENILPGMRDAAVASGQYGGSRQGILESKALSNVSRDTAGALSNLFGSANENAQNRMQSTAGQLNDQAGSLAVNNAGRTDAANQFNIGNQMTTDRFNVGNNLDTQKFNAGNLMDQQKFNSSQMQNAESQNIANMLQNQQFNVQNANNNLNRHLDTNKFNTQTQIGQNQFNANNALQAGQFNAGQQNNTNQFNANLGMQNNAQQQNFGQQNLQNRTNALGLFGQTGGLQDQNFQSMFNALGAKDKYNQANLNNYAGLIQPGANMGGSQSQSGPSGNMASNIFGGAMMGGQLANLWGKPQAGMPGGGSWNSSMNFGGNFAPPSYSPFNLGG
jgi:hypothetical protein